MVVFPGCKINIGLNIIGKRDDGFHNIESVFYPLNLSDILEIVESDIFSIKISGLSIDVKDSDNLVVKAYEILKSKFDLPPVAIHLHKIVPMGAGLGGGSADAAYTLLLLNDLFDLKISIIDLEQYADKLGSDASFFIRNTPMFVEGKGEIHTPVNINLKGYYIQLINPGIHISTKEAFGTLKLSDNKFDLKHLLEKAPIKWGDNVKNDFENSVFQIHPEIKAIKTDLYKNNALFASMTGTGSSVYAIYEDEPSASHPNHFEWIAKLSI